MKFTVKNGTATTPGIFLGSKLFILKLVKFESQGLGPFLVSKSI